MIYFALCAAIACLAAHYLRRMQLRAAGVGVIFGVSMVSGMLAGSVLAFGLMSASGLTPQQSALPAMFAQAFWWSLLGAVLGYFTKRIPSKHLGIGIGIGCAMLLILGSAGHGPALQAPALTEAPAIPPDRPNDSFDPSRAVPLETYNAMKKAEDDFNPARAVPLRN